jgi:hypothetical protein
MWALTRKELCKIEAKEIKFLRTLTGKIEQRVLKI